MKEQDKQLLLKDLCARLPYRTKCYCEWSKEASNGTSGCIQELSTFLIDELEIMGEPEYDCQISDIKPYLRPMSSMTEKECITLSRLKPCDTDAWKYIKTPIPLYVANIKQFDFFLRHHLDWRGLIPMGLALEAKDDMYKTE